MRLLGESIGFFSKKAENKSILSLSMEDYFIKTCFIENICRIHHEDSTLLHYIEKKSYLEDGYQEVILSNFDFVKSDLTDLLSVLDNQYVRISNAIFSYENMKLLLEKKFDLSRSTYHTSVLSGENYFYLYELASKSNMLSSLHSVYVDFSGSDLSAFPIDYIAYCRPKSFLNTKIRTDQFNFMISNFMNRKERIIECRIDQLNFSRIDISDLILEYHQHIEFESFHNKKTIFLKNIMLNEAIIDINALSICASLHKFHYLFDKPNLNLIIRLQNSVLFDYFQIDVDFFIKKFLAQKPIHMNEVDFLSEIASFVQRRDLTLNFIKMSCGVKLLWLAAYFKHHPFSKISMMFFKLISEFKLTHAQPEKTQKFELDYRPFP